MCTIDATLRVFSPPASISGNTVVPESAIPRSHRLNSILLSVYHNVDQRITTEKVEVPPQTDACDLLHTKLFTDISAEVFSSFHNIRCIISNVKPIYGT
jgi:hypothetical protein